MSVQSSPGLETYLNLFFLFANTGSGNERNQMEPNWTSHYGDLLSVSVKQSIKKNNDDCQWSLLLWKSSDLMHLFMFYQGNSFVIRPKKYNAFFCLFACVCAYIVFFSHSIKYYLTRNIITPTDVRRVCWWMIDLMITNIP